MLDFLALVILIAIFFGISLGAALNGALVFLIIIYALSIVITIAESKTSSFFNAPAKTPTIKTQPTKPKKARKSHPIIGDIIFFVITYLIGAVLLFACGIGDKPEIPLWVKLSLPCLSTIICYIVLTIFGEHIKKRASK